MRGTWWNQEGQRLSVQRMDLTWNSTRPVGGKAWPGAGADDDDDDDEEDAADDADFGTDDDDANTDAEDDDDGLDDSSILRDGGDDSSYWASISRIISMMLQPLEVSADVLVDCWVGWVRDLTTRVSSVMLLYPIRPMKTTSSSSSSTSSSNSRRLALILRFFRIILEI